MRKDEWAQGDVEQKIFLHTQNSIQAMCHHYGLHQECEVFWIANRKQVQLVHWRVGMSEWEKRIIKRYNRIDIHPQHAELVNELIVEFLLPRHEAFYKTKVDWYKILQIKYERDIVSALSIKVFDKPIFKGMQAEYVHQEERMATQISQMIKEKNRRGPDRVIVSMVNEACLTVIVLGLISEFTQEYIQNQPSAYLVIKDMLLLLVRQAVCDACQNVLELVVNDELFDIDIARNQIVVVTNIKKE